LRIVPATDSVTSSLDVSAIRSPSSLSPSSPAGRCSEIVLGRSSSASLTSATLSFDSFAISSAFRAARCRLASSNSASVTVPERLPNAAVIARL